MRFTKLALLSTGLCLSLFACRGGGDDGDDTPMPDGPPAGGAVKISEVQNDAMPVGTPVSVLGVVVTAIDNYGNRTGDFFVQDPAGGPFSGIKVFGAPLDQVAAIQVGDLVDITNAEKDEFALTEDDSGRKVTELKGAAGGMMTVTKKGTGSVPTPVVVDAKMLSTLSQPDREAEWEKWEGVLIKLTNVRQLTAITTFGSNPGPDSTEFRATGVARVQSALVELPASGVFGTCYESITGMGDYFFNDLVLPRSAADLVGGGTTCNAMATSITEAQTTNVEAAMLTDVYVAAVSFNKKNLWVTTSLTAAANEGIYIFRGNSMTTPVLAADVIPGARIDVGGAITENNNDATGDTVTQMFGPTPITVKAESTGDPDPVETQTAAMLTVAATGEPYESVLVTLTDVKVVTVGNSNNFYVGSLTQGGTTFLSDDDIVRIMAPELNKCFTMTGVWTYQVFSNAYGLLPISMTETPAGCL